MREVAAIPGIAGAAAPGPEGSGVQRSPRPAVVAPGHSGSATVSAPDLPSAAQPAVRVSIAGLTLEAVAWPRFGSHGAPQALRGTVALVPAPLSSDPEAASSLDPRRASPQRTADGSKSGAIATYPPSGAEAPAAAIPARVVGPLGAGALVLASEDLLILVRGGNPQLPQGARVLLSWLGRPEPTAEPMPALAEAARAEEAAAPEADRAGAEPHLVGDGRAGARSARNEGAPAALGSAAATGGQAPVEEPGSAARAEAAAPAPSSSGPQAVGGEPAAPSLTVALARLATLLGLVPERRDEQEEAARDRQDDREEGRAVMAIDFPALGRVRLEIHWSPRAIDLRLCGSSRLAELDRGEIQRAFADGLALLGGRGRIVVLEHVEG